MTVERAIYIIQAYVDQDIIGASNEYVRYMLMDICGCSREEIVELGYEYLLDGEEDYD